jgi:hypothetical protein
LAEVTPPPTANPSPGEARGNGWIGRFGSQLARLDPERVGLWLAAATVVLGVVVAASTLGRGAWLDEFWTLASTGPDMPPAEFFAIMARDVHPLLHYGLVFVVRSLGLEDLIALRALNMLGAPLVAWALWLAHRRGAISTPQAIVLTALYVSSIGFLAYLAELRAYFLVFSSSVGVALLWRLLARTAAGGGAWGPGLLAAWGLGLAVFVNLHYFATLLGGLLTLALLVMRPWRATLPLAVVSLLAAAPAVAVALVQAANVDTGIVSWVQSGRIDAAFMMVEAAWGATAYNVVALGCALAAALYAVERGDAARGLRDEIALAAVMLAYYGILLSINLVRPIIVDRYLIAAGGPLVVLVALLAGGAGAPRWGPAAVCLFALALQGRALYAGTYRDEGWSTSARFVAEAARACPTTRVVVDPMGSPPHVRMYIATMRYGLRYYADRLGFDAIEVGPGDTLPPSGDCPTLVWLEHHGLSGATSGPEALAALQLETASDAQLLRIGSGAVIVLR